MGLVAPSALRTQFFDLVFEDHEGYVCIAYSDPVAPRSHFSQRFYHWPEQAIQAENFILKNEEKYNMYFCINMLDRPERKKEYCLPGDVLWADLDEADPDSIEPQPQIVIQSSPGRYQAIWKLSTKIPPDAAETYAKRIAYASGADKSGWDLTQLLRIPFTKNYKYHGAPTIELARALSGVKAAPLLFEKLPKPPLDPSDPVAAIVEADLPDLNLLPDANTIVYKYQSELRKTAFDRVWTEQPEPGDDWSKSLWRLIHICFEVGMSPEEAFVVCKDSSVNKYARDHRPVVHLWRDILKAASGQERLAIITANFRPLVMPLIADLEADYEDTFVDRYRDWAQEATDAVVQFHELSAFIMLSAVIANSVRLSTSYGTMVPNLWGLILGDSTLTRKTTAMRMVIELIALLDQQIILATDGTAEGLLSGLSERCNKTSIFYKDEVSGFFESINRRDYLAGMPETLTALYDVPPVFTRRLRKETIHIESPVFIFFGGGVREKVYQSLTEDYVLSGFLPRFLVVSGDTELDRLRRTGPANELGLTKRASLVTELADLYEHYASDTIQTIGGQKMHTSPIVTANLTQSAWDRYGVIEETMVREASNSSIPGLALPTFERLSRSCLKMALVIGAARQVPKDEEITIELSDIEEAARYVQRWGPNSIDLITNAGKGVTERILERIENAIERHPGILRSSLMQHYKMTKREADEILSTLEDRQIVRKEKRGRGFAYFIA